MSTNKPKTIMIDDEKYIRESDVNVEEVNITVNKSVAEAYIGNKAIIRTRNEGINAGIIVAADDTGIVLKDCRRIWYHRPKNNKLSWYEGVAVSGLSSDSKVSGTVPTKVLIENYSITICTDEAFKSTMEQEPNGC